MRQGFVNWLSHARQQRAGVGATSKQFSTQTARIVALYCLIGVAPSIAMAVDQFPWLHPAWSLVFGVGAMIATVGLLIQAIRGRDIGFFGVMYAVVTLVGTATWPLAWLRPDLHWDSRPWLWTGMGVSILLIGIVLGARWGAGYGVILGVVHVLVSLQDGAHSFQLVADLGTLWVLPFTLLLLAEYWRLTALELDDSIAVERNNQAKAGIAAALVAEQAKLEAIVHDEVMTVLILAAQSQQDNDPRRVQFAERAMTSLTRADLPSESGQMVTARQLGWLIEKTTASACPRARVTVVCPGDGFTLPESTARVLTQSVREAALNAHHHADAESIDITVRCKTSATTVELQVEIRDNGRGFDPALIPEQRLGIKVSLRERMEAIGGQARIESEVGRGTTVTLSWRSQRDTLAAQTQAGTEPRPSRNPVLSVMRVEFLIGALCVNITVHMLMGWVFFSQIASPWPVVWAQLIAIMALFVLFWRFGTHRLSGVRAWFVVGATAVISELASSVLPYGTWPGYGTWYTMVVSLILVAIMANEHWTIAWTGGVIFLVQLCLDFSDRGLGVNEVVRAGFGPVVWVFLAWFSSRFVSRLGSRLRQTRNAAQVAAHATAVSYSKLVLNEVWLAQVKNMVWPVLTMLADPDHALTDADRRQCRTLEARLRDHIRAGDLVTAGSAESIAEARARGVDVVLIDNRKIALPEPVRLAAGTLVQRLLKADDTKRVVVRAAPVDYPEVMTILAADRQGELRLYLISESGMVTLKKP